MNTSTCPTLAYARVRRSPRRRLVAGCLVALPTLVFAWVVCVIGARVAALEADPNTGPVDWAAVIRSPTLLKLAWRLAAKGEVASLFGARSEEVVVELNAPARFENGRVTFQVTISNGGQSPIVVPPYNVSGAVPRNVGCMPADILAGPSSLLGDGVRVIAPGQSASVALTAPANRRPANTIVSFLLFDRFHSWFVHAGGGLRGRFPYENWSDVPVERLEHLGANIIGSR